MSAKVLGLSLLAWQIILIQSAVIQVKEPVVSADHPTRPETQSPTLPQGYQSFPDVRSAFKIYENETSWFEARDRCSAEGARLAIADTREKIAHIDSMRTPSDKWLHVGFHKVDGEWVRIDNGLPVSSIPWAEDNPDGSGDCSGLSIVAQRGLLNYGCELGGEYYVCEIPETPTTPQGYRAFPDVQSTFKIYEVETSWFEARDRCSAEGARLAIADTREKIAHINSIRPPSDKWLSVGIRKVDDQWVRIDNDLPVSSVPWAEDNPDGTGDCAGISTVISENGLVDHVCESGGKYYVCEIPL